MWQNPTHDWATTVDVAHLSDVRATPTTYAPNGAFHLGLGPSPAPSTRRSTPGADGAP